MILYNLLAIFDGIYDGSYMYAESSKGLRIRHADSHYSGTSI